MRVVLINVDEVVLDVRLVCDFVDDVDVTLIEGTVVDDGVVQVMIMVEDGAVGKVAERVELLTDVAEVDEDMVVDDAVVEVTVLVEDDVGVVDVVTDDNVAIERAVGWVVGAAVTADDVAVWGELIGKPRQLSAMM